MNHHLIDILSIGDGILIFSYLNLCSKNILKLTLKEFYILAEKGSKHFKFYGMKLPTHHYLFDEIYLYNSNLLSKYLEEKRDLIDSPIASLDENKNIIYKNRFFQKIWNNLTLLEFAYLLQDYKAISILKKYGRTIYYCSNKFKIDKGNELALKYGEYNLIN
jgi:hypothetical protein